MIFFTMNPNIKIIIKKTIFRAKVGGGGGGGITSELFSTKNPNIQILNKKIKIFFFVGWGGEWRVRVDEWTDKQAQTNSPLQLLQSWGHNNALMYK